MNTAEFLQKNVSESCGSAGFSVDGIPAPEEVNNQSSNLVEKDVQLLSATELREKYRHEYSSWKNMKSRRKQGAVIDPRFEKFGSFLSHMGAKPGPDWTIDRTDYKNPTYGPEVCRWADKFCQSSNKGNNVFLEHDGQTLTIAQWAAKTGQKSSALYKRRSNGWSTKEIITGKREKGAEVFSKMPWPKDNSEAWDSAYREALFKRDICPFEFYKHTCQQALMRLEDQLETAYQHPEIDDENLTPQILWDQGAQALWASRWEAVSKLLEQRSKKDTLRKRLSKYGLKSPSESDFRNSESELIHRLQELTGRLPKDRPQN